MFSSVSLLTRPFSPAFIKCLHLCSSITCSGVCACLCVCLCGVNIVFSYLEADDSEAPPKPKKIAKESKSFSWESSPICIIFLLETQEGMPSTTFKANSHVRARLASVEFCCLFVLVVASSFVSVVSLPLSVCIQVSCSLAASLSLSLSLSLARFL